MADIKGMSGKTYRLGDAFAAGGEGNIHNINGMSGFVAKIYKPGCQNTEHERKLRMMVQNPPGALEQYAWPTDILYENGKFVGFVMPRITGKEKLNKIYAYGKRAGKPWSLYVAIASNLAIAVHNVHDINQVIGDLNPDNILADPVRGLVTLVDTDSYHIYDGKRTYRCGVGRPEFVPRELQGKNLSEAPLPTFTKETDRFALAVLIFALLMNGNNPFACVISNGSASTFQPVDNIKNGKCAFFADSKNANMVIPPSAPEMSSLPKPIQTLFHRAFIEGHRNPSARPTAEEWYKELNHLRKMLVQCARNSEHLYFTGAARCPWCDVDYRMSAAQRGSNMGTSKSYVKQTPYVPPQNTTATPTTNQTTYQTSNRTSNRTNQPPKRSLWKRILQWIVDVIIDIWDGICDFFDEYFADLVLIVGGIAVAVLLGMGILKGGRALIHKIKGSDREPTEIAASLVPGDSQPEDSENEGISENEGNSEEESGISEDEGNSEEGSGTSDNAPPEIELTGTHTALTAGGREAESNNSRELANQIQVNEKYTGFLSAKQKTESDWYVFVLDQPGKVSFTTETKKKGFHPFGNPVYWEMTLMKGNDDTALLHMEITRKESKNPHTSETKELDAGIYYFRVQSGPKKVSTADYTFTIHYTPDR